MGEKIKATAKLGIALGVPIHYGEFGVGRRLNQEERDSPLVPDFYRFIAMTISENGMSMALWDDRGWF